MCTTRIIGALLGLTLALNVACRPAEPPVADQTTTTTATTESNAPEAAPEATGAPPAPVSSGTEVPDAPGPEAPAEEPDEGSTPLPDLPTGSGRPRQGTPPSPPISTSPPGRLPGTPPTQSLPGQPSSPEETASELSPPGSPAPVTTSTTSTTTTTTVPPTTTSTTVADQPPQVLCDDMAVAVAGEFITYDFWVVQSCFSDANGGQLQAYATQGHYGSVTAPTDSYCQNLAGNAWCWTYTPANWDGTPYWDAFNVWVEDTAGNMSEPLRFDLCVNC
jgi:hypothetical protein